MRCERPTTVTRLKKFRPHRRIIAERVILLQHPRRCSQHRRNILSKPQCSNGQNPEQAISCAGREDNGKCGANGEQWATRHGPELALSSTNRAAHSDASSPFSKESGVFIFRSTWNNLWVARQASLRMYFPGLICIGYLFLLLFLELYFRRMADIDLDQPVDKVKKCSTWNNFCP